MEILVCTTQSNSHFPVDFQLRGVCLHSQVDSFFLLKTPTELKGHGKSTIKWFQSDQVWKIINSTATLAVLAGPQPKSFPLGDHLWEFTQSDCVDPEEEAEGSPSRRFLEHDNDKCGDINEEVLFL